MDRAMPRSEEEAQYSSPRIFTRARTLSLATGIVGLVLLAALLLPLLASGSRPAHAGAPTLARPGGGQGLRSAANVDPPATRTPNRQATAATKAGRPEEAKQFLEPGQPNLDSNVPSGLTGVSSLLADPTPEDTAVAGDADKTAPKAASPTPAETQLPEPGIEPAGPGVAPLANGPGRNSPNQPFAVLYNQDNNVGDASITSQDDLNSQTADDFVVPAGQTWEINQVQAAYSMNGNGPVESFNVFFYANSGTLPGTPVYSMTNQPYAEAGSERHLITLSTPAILSQGTYWVSVQANLTRIPNGQWFWANREVQSNNKAAWRNPGDRFGTGCTDWGVRMDCVPSNDPDQLFILFGVAYTGTPSPTSTGTTPTRTPTASPTATPSATPCTRTWTIEESENAGTSHNRLLAVSASSPIGTGPRGGLPTDVWAVGYYVDEATLHYRTLIERWNGVSWEQVDSPNQGQGDNILRDVTVVSPTDIWAVGSYTEADGETRNLILHYNGVEWSITPGVPNLGSTDPVLGTLITNELNAVHHSGPNDVWAVGRYIAPRPGNSYQKPYYTLVLHYNGSAWSVVNSPNPEDVGSGASFANLLDVYALAPNDVWAVGQYLTYLGGGGLDFYLRTLIMRYNGSTWTVHNVTDLGNENSLQGVVALGPNDVWAVGSYDGNTLTRHWDGTEWTHVESPSPGEFSNGLYEVSAVGPDDIWAVGFYQAQIPAPFGGFYYRDQPLMLNWDGTAWRDKSGPGRTDPGGTPLSNHLYGVAAIATDDVWAVGSYFTSTQERTLAEHYSGPCATPGSSTATPTRTATRTATPEATLTASPTSVTPTAVTAVPVPYCVPDSPNVGIERNILTAVDLADPNNVWAVGHSADDFRDDETLIMRWNGLNWKTVPSPNGTSGEVNYLFDVSVISPDDIWAVGYYWNGFVGNGRYQTLTLHWNGDFWAVVVSPNVGFGYNYLSSVTAVAPDDVWAVGYYEITEGVRENLVLHWTGSSGRWSVVYTPGLGNLTDVDHSAANEVWATGSYILRYDGTEWDFHTHSGGMRSFGGGAIEVIAPNDVWELDFAAAHWNGSAWTYYDLPMPQSDDDTFYFSNPINSVSASATDNVWGVGSSLVFDGEDFFEEPWVVRWNGTEWELIENPLIDEQSSELHGVAVIAPDDIWTVGQKYTDFFQTKTLTVHYGQECPPPPPTCGPESNYLVATATATIEPGGQDIGLHCSDCVQAINFPFPVTLYGQQYISATLGANGTIQFNSASTEEDSDCLPNDNFNTTIFGHLSAGDTEEQPGDGIYTTTLGTAPNRTFYIEWRSHWIGSSSSPINFEVVFKEGQTAFDIVYGDIVAEGGFGIVGVQRDIGSRYTVYECSEFDTLLPGLKLTFYQNDVCPATATPTATRTRTSTRTPLATSTRTATPTRTREVTGTAVATQTGVPSTSTYTATRTAIATGTATRTSTRTAIATGTPTRTATPVFSATSGPSPTRTATRLPTNTSIPSATRTSTRVSTATATSTPCTEHFTDVSPEDTFYTYIKCLACRGVISGFSDRTFRSWADITRGQIAKVVSNAAGFFEDPGEQIYADVPPSHTYYEYINRLTNRGIVRGYPCPVRPDGEDECTPEKANLFKPNENATRGQLAKIVSNAAGFDEAVSGQHYADVPPTGEGSQFYEWIMRLTSRGVIDGYACGTSDSRSGPCDDQSRPYFRPANPVTRGQASKIVANTFFPNCETP